MRFIKYKKSCLAVLGMLLFLMLWFCPADIYADDLNIEKASNLILNLHNNDSGLPTGEANALCQTKEGYIWIGSYAGLIRYDGKQYKNYSEEDEFPNGIRDIYEDSEGILWIGTNDDGVFSYANHEFNDHNTINGENLPSVRCFTEGKDSIIYAGSANGVYYYENNSFRYIDIKEVNDIVYCIGTDKYGSIWGISGSNIFIIRDKKLVRLFTPGELAEEEYYSLFVKDSKVYIGTANGDVLTIDISSDTYDDTSLILNKISCSPMAAINQLTLTRSGTLWIGASNGTGYLDENNVFHTNEEFEECYSVSDIMEDYEGDIWISSTKRGVYQVCKGKYYHLTGNNKSAADAINAIGECDSFFIIGTDSGLEVLDNNWEKTVIPQLSQLDNLRIRDILTVGSTVWICTANDGVFSYNMQTGQLNIFNKNNGLISDRTRKAELLKNGRIAILTGSGVSIIENGVVSPEAYGQAQGLETTVVLTLVEADNGTLYAGTDGGGVYRLKDGQAVRLISGAGDSLKVVLLVKRDMSDNGYWISSGSKIYYMDTDENIALVSDFNYGIGSIIDIIQLDRSLIILKSDGYYEVNRTKFLQNEIGKPNAYSNDDGLKGNLVANSRNYLKDNQLYLCTTKGISILPIGSSLSRPIAPRAFINEIVVQTEKNKEIIYYIPSEGSTDLVLPEDTIRISFKFACLSYSGQNCTIGYFLKGFDKRYISIQADSEDSATYTNLAGGDYVFSLSAENYYRGRSDVITVNIHKNLTLWEHLYFRIICCGVVLLGIVLTAWLLVKRARKEKERYRQITRQSLETIAMTIDTRDKYTRGHSLRVAKYSEELARRLGMKKSKQENIYFIGLLHDIGKIGTPDAILNKPGKLTEEEFNIIKRHTVDGSDILEKFTEIEDIGAGARWHHEKIDGTGYPDKKKGSDIPYAARIICVADAYDAMSSDRPYRKALEADVIIKEFEKGRGSQFDIEICNKMIQMIKDGCIIKNI